MTLTYITVTMSCGHHVEIAAAHSRPSGMKQSTLPIGRHSHEILLTDLLALVEKASNGRAGSGSELQIRQMLFSSMKRPHESANQDVNDNFHTYRVLHNDLGLISESKGPW